MVNDTPQPSDILPSIIIRKRLLLKGPPAIGKRAPATGKRDFGQLATDAVKFPLGMVETSPAVTNAGKAWVR
jgi:hypothetical protein